MDTRSNQISEHLTQLEQIIRRMEVLGESGENAAARVVDGIGHCADRIDGALCAAIGDVLEIMTERSTLAHRAYRLIVEMRRQVIAQDDR